MTKIAISGHRHFSEKEQLRIAIQKVLGEIIQTNPEKGMWLYSPLAEGQEEYFKDFSTEEGKQEFHTLLGRANKVVELPAMQDHKLAYQQLGAYLVKECDVLVALWDGEGGKDSGGTGEVVEKARASGRKIYWIYCENGKKKSENGKRVGEIEVLN